MPPLVTAGAPRPADVVMSFGKATVGDKTMIDAIVPFVDDLSQGVDKGAGLRDAWTHAAGTAEARRAEHRRPGREARPGPFARQQEHRHPRSRGGLLRADLPARLPTNSRVPRRHRAETADHAKVRHRVQPEDVFLPSTNPGLGGGGRGNLPRPPRHQRRHGRISSSSRPSPAFPVSSSWPGRPASRSAHRTCTGRTPVRSPARSAAPSWPRSAAAWSKSATPSGGRSSVRPTRSSLGRRQAGFRNGLAPVLCIGEPERPGPSRPSNSALSNSTQRWHPPALEGLSGRLIVAYEPIWAIGAPEPASPAICPRRLRSAAGAPRRRPAVARREGRSTAAAPVPGCCPQIADDVDGMFLGRFAHDPAAVRRILDEVDQL